MSQLVNGLRTRALATTARALSTSAAVRKSPGESMREKLKSANKVISDNVVSPGLEAAAAAGAKVKQGAESLARGEAAEKAAEKAGEFEGKAEWAKSVAAGKAKGVADKVKGKMEEQKRR